MYSYIQIKVHTMAIRLTAGGGVIMLSVRSQNIETTQTVFNYKYVANRYTTCSNINTFITGLC